MQLRKLIVLVTLLLFGTASQSHAPELHQASSAASTVEEQKDSSKDNSKEITMEKVKIAAPGQPQWGRNYFPNVPLITQDGETVRFFDDLIEGKVVAVNFIYTSCEDTCPLETAQLKKVYDILGDRVGRDIHFLSISIDPQTDTPAVLRAYKEKFGLGGANWTFLTGEEADITLLRKKFGIYYDEEADPDDHNISLMIGNQANGRWMKRSPFENPGVLATQLGDWLHNWQSPTLVSSNSYVDASRLPRLKTGETIFRTRCSACHAFGADGLGPDLMGVTRKRDPAWLLRWIREPDKMLAEKDPLATALMARYRIPMPNMRLGDKDANSVIAYIEAESTRLSTSLE